jgi:hypothetical protein
MQTYARFSGFADIPKEARNLLVGLAIAITEVEIQQERVKAALDMLEKPRQISRVVERQAAQRQIDESLVYERFVADVHLYLVAWANINKILIRLRRTLSDPKLDWIQERRRGWFKKTRQARNRLEHIDQRIVNASSAFPPLDQVYITSKGKSIAVFGARIDISDSGFNKITALRNDLQRWYSNLPTILDRFEREYGTSRTKLSADKGTE